MIFIFALKRYTYPFAFQTKDAFFYEAIFLLQMMNALMYPFVTEPLHLEYSIINFASGGSHFTFYNLTI